MPDVKKDVRAIHVAFRERRKVIQVVAFKCRVPASSLEDRHLFLHLFACWEPVDPALSDIFRLSHESGHRAIAAPTLSCSLEVVGEVKQHECLARVSHKLCYCREI